MFKKEHRHSSVLRVAHGLGVIHVTGDSPVTGLYTNKIDLI